MFKALKQCRFDRLYLPGELIEDCAVDKSVVNSAIKFGYIKIADTEAGNPASNFQRFVGENELAENQNNPVAKRGPGRKPKAKAGADE